MAEDERGQGSLARSGPRVAADVLSAPLAARFSGCKVGGLDAGNATFGPSAHQIGPSPSWARVTVQENVCGEPRPTSKSTISIMIRG